MDYKGLIKECVEILEGTKVAGVSYNNVIKKELEYSEILEEFKNDDKTKTTHTKIENRFGLYNNAISNLSIVNNKKEPVTVMKVNQFLDYGIDSVYSDIEFLNDEYYGLSIETNKQIKAKIEEIKRECKNDSQFSETKLTNDDIENIKEFREERRSKKGTKSEDIKKLIKELQYAKSNYINSEFDTSCNVYGAGQLKKNPYISIRADGVSSGKEGFYVTIDFRFGEGKKTENDYTEINRIIINLTFGSQDKELKENSGVLFSELENNLEKCIGGKTVIIKTFNNTSENKKNSKNDENSDDINNDIKVFYRYIIPRDNFDYDNISKKLDTILSLYKAGLEYIDKQDWEISKKRKKWKSGLFDGRFKNAPEDIKKIGKLLRTTPQIVLYGPPGTGKTRTAKIIAGFLTGCLTNEKDIDKNLERLNNDNHFMMVQFHPGYSYSEFVETISMEKEYSDKGGIKYGKFRELVKRAEENKNNFYCLIIDEINRANVSETCGELLYGLEYRDGVPIRTSISEAELTVPSNIYIICTMNTADRSLQSLDYALRRRFVFVPVYSQKPEPKNKKPYYKIKTGKFFMNGIYDKVSEWINDSCARGVEPVDIMPGVSYFLVNVNEKDGSYDADHLDYKLEYELLPLLEEYMKNGMFSKRNKIFENKSLAEMLKYDRLALKTDLISEVKQ